MQARGGSCAHLIRLVPSLISCIGMPEPAAGEAGNEAGQLPSAGRASLGAGPGPGNDHPYHQLQGAVREALRVAAAAIGLE